MRDAVRTIQIDAGVRNAVALLSRIPGVTTRASCQGVGPIRSRRRHGDLAYVRLTHPMPLQLQDFLVERLASLARIESDGVYSRWPAHNRAFLESLEVAARSYLSLAAPSQHRSVRQPLAKLRARLAREVSRRQQVRIGLCFVCEALVGAPHQESHRFVPLLSIPPDQHIRWFADFGKDPENALEADLITSHGWPRLMARTQRGDFGLAFRRRWLRHRARMIATLSTRDLRSAVEDLRRQDISMDFFYDNTHAVFTWS